MKVFLGFGYNDNDKWVVDLVIPFLQTLGCEVLTGEEMQGENLADGVIERIKDADVCVGLLTKRDDPDGDGIFTTHKWVIQEIAAAASENPKKPTYEIIEKGVDPQKGMLGGNQHLVFEDKAVLLLNLAKFIMKEKGKLSFKTFMLLPKAFSDAIMPNLKYTKCQYQFLYKGKEYEPEDTNVIKMAGTLSVIIRKIPSDDALVKLTVDSPGNLWVSDYVSVGSINVELSKSV